MVIILTLLCILISNTAQWLQNGKQLDKLLYYFLKFLSKSLDRFRTQVVETTWNGTILTRIKPLCACEEELTNPFTPKALRTKIANLLKDLLNNYKIIK